MAAESIGFSILGLLSFICLIAAEKSFKVSTSKEEKDNANIYVYPAGFRGGRYYYGGIYRGSCHNDGLYYHNDDSFVVCSNGNPYVQPCAPGTKSSGQHRYSPGYYYGYSDFCDINLVDQGYGPAHYAPYDVRYIVSKGKGKGKDGEKEKNSKPKSTSYGYDQRYHRGNGYDRYTDYYVDSYPNYGAPKPSYGTHGHVYATKARAYSKDTSSQYGDKKSLGVYAQDPYRQLGVKAKPRNSQQQQPTIKYKQEEQQQQQQQQQQQPNKYNRENVYISKETAYASGDNTVF